MFKESFWKVFEAWRKEVGDGRYDDNFHFISSVAHLKLKAIDKHRLKIKHCLL